MKVKVKKFLLIHLQTAESYHEDRIRSEINILQEIILNVFKCLTKSLSNKNP